MKISNLIPMICGLVLVAGGAARADIIYNNAPVDDFDSIFFSDVRTGAITANSFTLNPGASTITDISWWGAYNDGVLPAADDFTIRIYSDDGGLPDDTAPLLLDYNVGSVARVDSGLDTSQDGDAYAYSVNISALTLNASTTYWLAIYNETPGYTPHSNEALWSWLESEVGSGDKAVKIAGLPSPWVRGPRIDDEPARAFTLSNASQPPVPEPTTMALLGLGLGGLVLRSRRTRDGLID